ncbi:hypothetical protein Lal_00044307 [Lupinus albus]|nr:hypothetical protein Lal_00044307 [Lupinus albus]
MVLQRMDLRGECLIQEVWIRHSGSGRLCGAEFEVEFTSRGRPRLGPNMKTTRHAWPNHAIRPSHAQDKPRPSQPRIHQECQAKS